MSKASNKKSKAKAEIEALVEEQDEVSFEMETSEDAKVVTLRLVSTREMTVGDLIMALETYLSDLTRAETQRREPGVLLH